ncbi:MAG: CCA tRNA nucleotidyltransferase, partial [Erythrobacter sp.]|nr:CCA tRNA nucleotidyltransferase [Erythrobacter sp.]
GRRATVAFSTHWQDDAARRDFTINALYAHPQTLAISDWFDGLADLDLRRVRFIGDARERIREDHLRILRYYRFQARFGAMLDGEAEAACADMAPMLKGLSRERVAMELLTLLALPSPFDTVARMFERGVLPVVLPEVDAAGIAALGALLAAEADCDIAPAAIRRLAALLPADPRLADQVAARLRLSTAQRKHLVRLARRLAGGEQARALAYAEGRAVATDLLLLARRNPVDIGPDPLPMFPLKGGQVVARGVGAGPEVARVLQAVEARWIAEQFPGEERVAQLLDEALRG